MIEFNIPPFTCGDGLFPYWFAGALRRGGGGGVRRTFDDHMGQILSESDHGRDGR